MPPSLFTKSPTIFNAYVNIGSLEGEWRTLAQIYPNAKFILLETDCNENRKIPDSIFLGTPVAIKLEPRERLENFHYSELIDEFEKDSTRFLALKESEAKKWKKICDFLDCTPPTSRFPDCIERGQRKCSEYFGPKGETHCARSRLKWDSSPWVISPIADWSGLSFDSAINKDRRKITAEFGGNMTSIDSKNWMLMDDTFPSNLALFRPENFQISSKGHAILIARKESSDYRNYTAASICTREPYLYGCFEAVLKVAKGSGLVTGIFLHRNNPRQEIDIEILGKDPTKVLINVFCNPGSAGANFDYGYRGTPELIDLGFDASEDFHRYRIEWDETAIRWYVDDHMICQRAEWDPTPVPNLPLKFYINLWPSRSKEFSGRHLDRNLPAQCELAEVKLKAIQTVTG